MNVYRSPDLMENFQPNLVNSLCPQTLTYCEWREPGKDFGWIQAISVEDCHPSGEGRNSAWDTRKLCPSLLHFITRWEDLEFWDHVPSPLCPPPLPSPPQGRKDLPIPQVQGGWAHLHPVLVWQEALPLLPAEPDSPPATPGTPKRGNWASAIVPSVLKEP